MGAIIFATARHVVMVLKLHPILVNFTVSLPIVSVGSDLAARKLGHDSLSKTAWWTLLYSAILTPFTAITGWLFWMSDDNGIPRMEIHRWLGTALGFALLALCYWRWRIFKRKTPVPWAYFGVALVFVIVLVIQGHLGGEQVFSTM